MYVIAGNADTSVQLYEESAMDLSNHTVYPKPLHSKPDDHRSSLRYNNHSYRMAYPKGSLSSLFFKFIQWSPFLYTSLKG